MARKLTRFQWIQVRMLLLMGGLGTMLGLVIWKGHKLQYLQEEQHKERSMRQVDGDLPLRARRGAIVDRNGVELAASADLPSIYADPRYIARVHERDAKLRKQGVKASEVLDTNLEALRYALGEEEFRGLEAEIREKLAWKNRAFVMLARRVSPAVAARLREFQDKPGKGPMLRGLGVTPESRRFYPLRSRAGQLLGFLGRTEADPEYRGRSGLELTFDEMLEGKPYEVEAFTDVRGRRIVSEMPDFDKLKGQNLVLTLDERLQFLAESELAHAIRTKGAQSGSVVITDPKTGDILAMASVPVFNPNRIGDYDAEFRKNRAVLDTYEPGSTFKCFTVASALDAGVAGYHDVLDTEMGRMQLAEFTIEDVKPARTRRVWEVLKYSSNIGAVKLGRLMGKERYHGYLEKFGFGRRPDVPLVSEPGRLPPLKGWKDVEMATVTYGYGVNVTNLQLNMALGAIANGGTLYKPRLVKEVRAPDGSLVQSFEPTPLHRVISPEAAKLTARAMTTVVEEGGTGTAASTAHYKVAGKTGTARGVVERTITTRDGKTRSVWRYSDRHWRASFVGFAPAEDPALVITVVVNMERDGRGQDYGGGKLAAPVFSRIAQQALPLVGVFPKDKGFDPSALAQLTEEGQEPKARGGAQEIIHDPPSYTNGVGQPQGEREAEAAGLTPMPSYVGLSLRRALTLSREQGHPVTVEGSGRVLSQTPGPGTFVSPGVPVKLIAQTH